MEETSRECFELCHSKYSIIQNTYTGSRDNMRVEETLSNIETVETYSHRGRVSCTVSLTVFHLRVLQEMNLNNLDEVSLFFFYFCFNPVINLRSS